MATNDVDLPSVSVVVPVYNDVDRLRLCLSLIAEQDYLGPLVVYVVDNASTVDISEALPPSDGRFHLLHEPKKGSYAARNTGLAHVESEIIAFTDADCRPHPDWIRIAVARLTASDGPDAVGGRIRLVFRDGSKPRTAPELYEAVHDFDQQAYIEQNGFAATANMIVTREAIEITGQFDADLQSGGDQDWGNRLLAAGGVVQYCADAVIDHPSRPTWRDLTLKSARIARGLATRTATYTWRDDARYFRGEAVFAVYRLRVTWGRSSDLTVAARSRYSAAFAWAVLVDFVVRLRERTAARLRRRSFGQ